MLSVIFHNENTHLLSDNSLLDPSPIGRYGPGTLSLLAGPSITAFAPDMRLAGQQVDEMGRLTGERVALSVEVVHEGDASRYSVELPAASAGLIVIKVAEEGG